MLSNHAGIRLAGESTPGLVRKQNEDAFVCLVPPGGRAALAVVADGIGGHVNGGTASLICCRDLVRAFERRGTGFPGGAAEAEAFLEETVLTVNEKLFRRNRIECQARPMGSTVAAAIFTPEELVTVHAGDSRVYEWNAATGIRQLTSDHSCRAEDLRDYGIPAGADSRIAAHVITRAVGPCRNLELELHRFPRSAGSRYLLCSDGVSRELSDDRLAEVLAGAETPRRAVDQIMRAVLLAGGRDNATVVVGFPELQAEAAG